MDTSSKDLTDREAMNIDPAAYKPHMYTRARRDGRRHRDRGRSRRHIVTIDLLPRRHHCIAFSFTTLCRVGALRRGARHRGLDPVGPHQIYAYGTVAWMRSDRDRQIQCPWRSTPMRDTAPPCFPGRLPQSAA
uniref:Uncharacterized protein n=1 Tax=Arundo donax TaxID=35708 RepID=A0A0A8YZ65_ARUDO